MPERSAQRGQDAMRLSYDLHLHSCLSPCGDEDMTPGNIVGMAAIKGLDVIAVTDHNSCQNCEAALAIGEQYGVLVIPGMELTTMEEIHVVCLFPKLNQALEFDRYVYEKLQKIPNKAEIFGHQYRRDAEDRISGEEEYLLINATDVSFEEVYAIVERYGGVMIPAHIDKTANSLIANLGYIPPDSQFVCAEVKNLEKLPELEERFPYLKGCRVITDSDAHYLEHIHEPVNWLEAEEKTAEAVLQALTEKRSKG